MENPAALQRLAAWLRDKANVVFANVGISRSEDMALDNWTAEAATAVVQTNNL